MTTDDEYEMERLRAEVAQERQMREMIDQSLEELKLTVEELGKRADTVNDEDNEWKTRYETQVEMNQQLEKQSLLLATKIEESKRSLKDLKVPKHFKMGEVDEHQVTPHYVKALEKEKLVLESQLRDLEWRMDQESKAYHKATEERKTYVTEINAAKGAIEHMKQHKTASHETPLSTVRETPHSTHNNIPQDQRILDPRKGPIKKTAAVKNLPRL